MTEFTLKLDPATRDLSFDESGSMDLVEGDDVYAQNVNNTLNTWLGEFRLDETHGTDYARVLAQDNYSVADGEAEEVIRDGILQEPGISLINTIEVAIGPGRVLSASFSGEFISGETITLEELTQHG